MLNRRLARVRVMQTLYALNKSKGGNFLLAKDLIAEAFAPDLNSMEKQDKQKLSGMHQLANTYFDDDYFKRENDDDAPEEINLVLNKAKEFMKLRNRKDQTYFKNHLQINAEKVYDSYLYLLNFLVGIYEKSGSVLSVNKLLADLSKSNDLDYLSNKRSVTLEHHSSVINKLYTEAIVNNKHVNDYLTIINKTGNDDLAIVRYIIKNILLRHEILDDFFERRYIYWVEDRDILRTMLFHSFNRYLTEGKIDIEVLDEQWEETREFILDLYEITVSNDELYQEMITPHLKNWDMERIIETDLILLKMAVAELTEFPSIPVKVTLNEIIDISKDYSSEKSRIFINGVLESLQTDLKDKKLIKKTGRGMIDNR